MREKRVVSTGYNGTPRGVKNCSEGGCGRCNGWGDGLNLNLEAELGELVIGGEERGQAVMGEGLDECLCLHAEENALLEAGRERVSGGGTTGAVLYCNTFVIPFSTSSYPIMTSCLLQMSLFALYGQDRSVWSDGSGVFIIVFDGRGE